MISTNEIVAIVTALQQAHPAINWELIGQVAIALVVAWNAWQANRNQKAINGAFTDEQLAQIAAALKPK